MSFRSDRIFYFILLISTFLWNQQASFLTQKIALENLENSYRDKVASAVSRLLGQDNFIVIVNVDVGGTLKKTATSQKGYTPIPGLPTVPSRDKSLSGTILGSGQMGGANYPISSVKVNIDLDEGLLTPSIKKEIKSIVEKAIPETRDCEDCIKIGVIGFLPSEKKMQDLQSESEHEELRRENEELKREQRQAEETALNKKLEAVENRLKKAEQAHEESEKEIKSWEYERGRRDSLAHLRLVKFEQSRNIEDSIRNANTEEELRQVRDSKMRSDSTLLSKTMAIVDKQVGSKDEEKEESLLGLQIGGGGSSIMSSVIFILLIICLIIITFLAASNKKPKPIYLKPKRKKKQQKTVEDSSDINEEKTDNTASVLTPTPPAAITRDEDAIRSELRSLRQTAVSLTVGEKESASALIKEWLEDNPKGAENPEEA